MDAIAAYYEGKIQAMLRHPWKTAGAILLVAIVGSLLVMKQSTGFLPSMDEGGFVLDYDMPVGTSLSETDKNCRKIEEILSQIPEIRSYSRRTGMELGFFVTEQYTGDFLVSLKSLSERIAPRTKCRRGAGADPQGGATDLGQFRSDNAGYINDLAGVRLLLKSRYSERLQGDTRPGG